MRWPSPQDYREAIQNPSTCLSDDELRKGELELDALQLPLVHSGQYAAVFKLNGPRHSWAVRCFLHNFEDRTQRYRAISDFILRDDLECTVDFELIDKGIKVGSQWFPILKMKYVEGEALGSYIRNNMHSPAKLIHLASSFKEMMLALKENGIAHGDLQHDNIVVTADEQLRLIDYDGMFVPALNGWHSNELGHRNYQHPARTDTHYSPNLDNFSVRIISGALALLCEDSSFWQFNKGDESLLLTREDYLSPLTSQTFFTLEKNDDMARAWSRQIRSLLLQPLSTIPFIDEQVEHGTLEAVDPDKKLIVKPQKSEWLYANNSEEYEYVPEYFAETVPQNDIERAAIRDELEPVLNFFSPSSRFVAKSSNDLDDLAKLKRMIEQSLARGEVVLWSGGLRKHMASTRQQGQHLSGAANPMEFGGFCGIFLVSILACAAMFPVFPFLRVILSISALVSLIWLVIWVKKGKAKLQVSAKLSRHLFYALTERSFKACFVIGNPEAAKDADPFAASSVELVDIPLKLIDIALFHRDDKFLKETVEFRVFIPGKKLDGYPYKQLWLHGCTETDRASLKRRLRGLRIQCQDLVSG